MKNTEFDTDGILTEFLTDYVENNLENAERKAFEEYLDKNPEEKEFARKALLGRKALLKMHDAGCRMHDA